MAKKPTERELQRVNVERLAQQFREILNLALPAYDWSPLFEAGVLEGLRSDESRKFFERMSRSQSQKEQLANYAIDHCGIRDSMGSVAGPSKIFLECGSTICYLAGEIARQLESLERPESLSFLTNNLWALTALAGLVEIEPIQGTLLMQYCGFMPFRDTSSTEPSARKNDKNRYLACVDSVGECDAIFATCSNFSLIAGPLVGSRSNALTKRALAEAFANKSHRGDTDIYWLFHFEKIVPISEYTEIVMEEVTPRCVCAFAQVNERQRKAMQADSDFVEVGDLSKKLRDGHKWHRDLVYEELPALAPVHELNVSGDYSAWPEMATGHSLLIGLPRLNEDLKLTAVKWLEKEVDRANRIFASAGNSTRYSFLNKTETDGDVSVARLVVEER